MTLDICSPFSLGGVCVCNVVNLISDAGNTSQSFSTCCEWAVANDDDGVFVIFSREGSFPWMMVDLFRLR